MDLKLEKILDEANVFTIGLAIAADPLYGAWCLSLLSYSISQSKFFVVYQKYSHIISFQAIATEILQIRNQIALFKGENRNSTNKHALHLSFDITIPDTEYLDFFNLLRDRVKFKFVPLGITLPSAIAVLQGLRNDQRIVFQMDVQKQLQDAPIHSRPEINGQPDMLREASLACALCNPVLRVRPFLDWLED